MNIPLEPKPLFRPISLTEASKYSPWPERLLGIDPWTKPQRKADDILREYNDGWYASLLALWEKHAASKPTSPLAFFHQMIRDVSTETEKNYAVYRTRMDEALISIGNDFAIGDLVLLSEMYRLMIVRFVEDIIHAHGVSTLVETGCGTGINLFFTHALAGISRFIGGEICSNAVALGNRICSDLSLPGDFSIYDYHDPESLCALVSGVSEDYALLTCHSIEQIQVRESGFINTILALTHKPKVVIHIEPVQWKDGSFISRLCEKYATINRYNQDLGDLLAEKEAAGAISIVERRKRCFGISAFNPSSLIAWRPV
jgi:hypothetical protein